MVIDAAKVAINTLYDNTAVNLSGPYQVHPVTWNREVDDIIKKNLNYLSKGYFTGEGYTEVTIIEVDQLLRELADDILVDPICLGDCDPVLKRDN